MKKGIFLFFLTTLILNGCKPTEFKADVYTTDVEIANEGKVMEVPVSVTFTLMGKDKDRIFDRVVEISKKYLHPDSTFSKSKAMIGERLVIDTRLPMGTNEILDAFLKKTPRLAIFKVSQEKEKLFLTIESTRFAKLLSSEMRDINLMLSLNLPPKKSFLKILSDSRNTRNISATAVFVSKKPYLNFSKKLERRDSIEIEFNGGSDSIYAEIPPVIQISD